MTWKSKTLLSALAVLVTATFNALKAPAQGTAFVYQGQLATNGVPLNASYDMAFALYPTNVNGFPVAGPITNSATAVRNGLFTATLNFGAGVFNGNTWWLDIRVSPAGSNTFVELSPRQPILAVPYAVMANSASNLLGTVPATQLGGTIALGQLPATVVTNGSSGLTLTGIFSGNGSGLTNVTASAPAALSQGEAGMDNPTWVQWKAGQVDTFRNIGKHNFPHMTSKLKSQQTFKLVVDGSGLTAGLGTGSAGVGETIITNFLNNFQFAGCGWGGVSYPSFFEGQIVNGPFYSGLSTNSFPWTGKNGWWFNGGWDMTNLSLTTNATLVNAADFDFNEVEISAICAPWGSSFTLYTNSSTGWRSMGAIGAFSTLTTGAVFGTNWIVALPAGHVISQMGARNLMLYQNALGTNRIVNIWCLNTTVTNGVAFTLQYQPSSSMGEMLAVSNSIRAPIYAGWNPDLILFDSIESESAILTNGPLWIGFYKSNCTNADICLTGIYPTHLDGTGSDQDPINQNLAYQSNAMAMAVSYFDGHSALESTNNEILRGFWQGPQNDGVHMDGFYQGWDGLSAWAYMWYRWMDLQDIY